MKQKDEGNTPQDYKRAAHHLPPCILCGRRNACAGHNRDEVTYLLGSKMKNVVQILWGPK